jgi:hypothetical protein
MKEELSAQLEQARRRIASNAGALREDLDVGKHFKQSFRAHKGAYLSGGTILGLLLAKLPARKKKIYVERKTNKPTEAVKEAEKAGIWLVLLQFLFKTFRPAIMSFVSDQLTGYLKKRAESPK